MAWIGGAAVHLLGVAEGVGSGAEGDVALYGRLVRVAGLPPRRQLLRGEQHAREGVRAQARLPFVNRVR